MIVLGIDPGSIRTGWGVVRREGPSLRFIAAGTIDAGRDTALPERLCEIHQELARVIVLHCPQEMAVEDVFHSRFAASALKLGHARGVALLAGAQASLPISAYAPALVKRSIAGNGQAEKAQVARLVGALLGLRELPDLDATDALAIAITHIHASFARRRDSIAPSPARVSRAPFSPARSPRTRA
jgi:crossover junction endodeoxyribonuclease RuvC